jgi:hypothetical protein
MVQVGSFCKRGNENFWFHDSWGNFLSRWGTKLFKKEPTLWNQLALPTTVFFNGCVSCWRKWPTFRVWNDAKWICRNLNWLRLTVAIFTGHAPVRGHLYTVGLFDRDPTCRFCRKETGTMQHIMCCCEAMARQCYNVFWEPNCRTKINKHGLSKGPLPLHTRHRTAESALNKYLRVAQ